MPTNFTAPKGRDGEIDAFHDQVARLASGNGGYYPTYISDRRQLASWAYYRDVLDEVDAPAVDVRRLRALYLDLTEPEPTAGVPTPASELQATNTAEFIELLHTLRTRASLQGAKLAERAGLPVSQLYSLTDVSRGKLPTRIEQVRSLVTACGLSPDQVARVVRLWEEIRNPDAGSRIWTNSGTGSPSLPELEKIKRLTFTIPAGDELSETFLNVMRHAPGQPFDFATKRAVLRWAEQQPKGTRLAVGTTRDQVQALVANAMELLNEAMELSEMADADIGEETALLSHRHYEPAAAAG